MESMEKIVSLCKRRGFIFPSSEIYGGLNGAWDYGPLGVELKENIKKQWWRSVVTGRDDVVGLDSSIILPRETWVASGHVGTFTDPLVDCRACQERFRADQLPESGACPNCGGNLVLRPIRPVAKLMNNPPSTVRVHRDKPCGGGVTVRCAELLPFSIDPVVEDVVTRAVAPVLHLLAPEDLAEPEADWYAALFPQAKPFAVMEPNPAT